MILRSVTSRLVFSYCLLLLLLGGAFLLFTVVSFGHFTDETTTNNLAVRSQEIWNTSQGLLDAPDRLSDVMERRFRAAVARSLHSHPARRPGNLPFRQPCRA